MAKKPRPVGDYLRRNSLRKLHSSASLQGQLLARVRSLLPTPLDGHCVAAHLEGQRLLLFSDSPAWASRLNYLLPSLQRALANGGLPVERIRVRILVERRPLRRRTDPIRRLSEESAELLVRTAESIDDAELRDALLRLSRHRN